MTHPDPSEFDAHAAATGVRELKLPSGESKRLRYLGPWDEADVFALMGSKDGWYVPPHAQKHAYYCSGGILCWQHIISEAKRLKSADGSEAITATRAKEDLKWIEKVIRAKLRSSCEFFLNKIGPSVSSAMFEKFQSLTVGTATAADFKPLYDEGVVSRVASNFGWHYLLEVKIVSLLATEVLFQSLLPYSVKRNAPKTDFSTPGAWGAELQVRVSRALVPLNVLQQTKSLDGSPAATKLRIHTDFPSTFDDELETASAPLHSVIYFPKKNEAPADALIVPIADDGDSVMIVEISTTDPRDPTRVKKCLKWFEKDKLVDKVVLAHPGRSIVILLCWDGLLTPSVQWEYEELEEAAKKRGIRIFVIDSIHLRGLGVCL